MKERSTIPALFMAACAILAIAWAAPARPAGLDDSIILVAKRQLQDKLYSSTILLARPIGGDRHVGFIINKPTQVTLGKLFPTHEPSRKVSEPVFLGGPVSPEVIFALVQGKEGLIRRTSPCRLEHPWFWVETHRDRGSGIAGSRACAQDRRSARAGSASGARFSGTRAG